MPPLRTLFEPLRSARDAQRKFENWPPPPPIKPVPAGKSGILSIPGLPADSKPDEHKYGPAIIIALGGTGEITLRQWLDKLAQDPAGPQSGLRILLITNQAVQAFPNGMVKVRLLGLERAPVTMTISRAALRTRRAEMSELFQQVINYKRFHEWLQDNLTDLYGEIQVFVVGSLAEPIIGVLGDVLQILRTLPKSLVRPNPFASITALLALNSPLPGALSKEEVFAAQREIGRFTFNGPHVMATSFGISPVIRTALLDHLFFIENSAASHSGANQSDFETGQAIAETIFTLTHPSARPIWENLSNDLPQSGELRRETHQAVSHSLGIATLFVPLDVIQNYIAARLAYAAVFGERADALEGLIHQGTPSEDLQKEARLIARRLLLDGPCKHPLFEWLWEANGPADLLTVPALSRDYIAVFQAQLSHGLVNFLNNTPADLNHLHAALEYLNDHLLHMNEWFRQAKVPNADAPERLTFQFLLNKWRETVQHFINAIQDWQQVFGSTVGEFDETSGSEQHADWRKGKSTPADWRAQMTSPASQVSGPVTSPQQPENLSGFLQKTQQAAERTIVELSKGRICRAVASDPTGDLKELEDYYTGTIRPELSRYIKENSVAFTGVHECLGWWVSLAPNRSPELLLVCWPSSVSGDQEEPPSEACFKPDDIERLGQALLRLGWTQAQMRAADLTGPWFRKRIGKMADFLRRAAKAFISYDDNRVAALTTAATRRSYLISYDPLLNRDYLQDVFPNTPRFELNELSGGEPFRFTALTLRLNIPLDAIIPIRQAYEIYREKSQEPLHLYSQEANAVLYERYIWKNGRMKILLPPELVTSLAEHQLVTLFCQAVFCKVIDIAHDKNGQDPHWTVASVGNFARLPLKPANKDGLLQAFCCFALELPNNPEVELNQANHFHSTRRKEYISTLTKVVKERSFQPGIKTYREKFRKKTLTEWQQRGESDLLAKAFAYLLSSELDEPLWRGW